MSFATRFNKGNRWEVDTTGFEFYDLASLYKKDKDRVYKLKGLYINNKGKFDPAPVLITDEMFVNAPAHFTMNANAILADDVAIDDIKAGKVGFKIYSYTSTNYNRTCYSVEFVDIK